MLFPALRNRPDKDPNIGFVEKLAYGMGDFASQLMLTPVSMLFIYYCTETVNVNIATVAAIMLISRIFDGFSDLLVGYLVERTNTPYGKSRVWIFRMVIPFFLSGVAVFSVPSGWSDLAKYIYIFIVYNITVTVVYTIANLSYGVLSVSMTSDSYQRSVLVIFRMLSSTAAGTIVMTAMLPMVRFFGDDQTAWSITSGIFCGVGALVFFFTAYFCHERIVVEQEQQNFKEALSAIRKILKNRYWIMLSIAMLCVCAADIVGGSVNTYYCKYFLGNDELIGPMSVVANVCKVAGMILVVPLMLKRFGKRNSLIFASLLIVLANSSRFIAPYSVELNYVISAVTGFCSGFTYTCLFAMIPDCVEYSEYRDHERHEGLVYSSVSFASKAAGGVGIMVSSLVMDLGGYVNNADVQSETAMNAILASNTLISPLMYIVAIICLFFYKIDKIYDMIMQELNRRRVEQAKNQGASETVAHDSLETSEEKVSEEQNKNKQSSVNLSKEIAD